MHFTTCSPHRNLRPFNRNLNLFDDFFAPFSGVVNDTVARGYRPSVDIYEKEDRLCIEAELPGFDKENIKVDVNGRLLTIGGERVSNEAVKDENKYRRERHFGSFERSFKLPFEVNEEQISATYKDGVLTLLVEKPEEQKPKQITIN
jgi:HSP20 family protein